MKLSVSLPEVDVQFIDEYLSRGEGGSRSAVIQLALGLLRESSMREEYAVAFAEWDASDDAALWESTAADDFVVVDAAR
ncbi:ribbon-helix-helix domain-containing protein [Actinokineospora terrae]|uniref:Transcriptional regulator, contains Arc/MetJ-type RHH (Ribbon-helix-helix) DNA-binding domain n=1 Tax=Actinokineospora terrae TaxID=155974 RepID=A0A1H9V893_9PSEU|nr:antitoxin [Actinokineospora terrae]SES18006.1 Transcriptional regulator, contains Arc/MetJ-type RHH (ribbon-helix-helix) DNA-binding domain [Actinokineospora terrae]